jgi:hypothetical protein
MSLFSKQPKRPGRPGGGIPKSGTRLGVMIGLLVFVIVLMEVSRRPEIWSNFLPEEDQPVPQQVQQPPQQPAGPIIEWSDTPVSPSKTRPANSTPSRPAARPRIDWTMGTFIILAVIYFSYRIFRISRTLSRRPGTPAHGWPRDRRNLFVDQRTRARADGEQESELPIPIPEPPASKSENR